MLFRATILTSITQELREKDEQLKVFQIELEQLISAMRAQDREGNKSIPASDAVTAYQ